MSPLIWSTTTKTMSVGRPSDCGSALPDDVPPAESLKGELDAGIECREAKIKGGPPRSPMWVRFPAGLGDDPRVHACALAYLSDVNPMHAVTLSHPAKMGDEGEWSGDYMGASLDHAIWFHRPGRVDDWVLLDMTGHGMIGSRGLATGPVFSATGTHLATIAQEGLLRAKRPQQPGS